MSNNVTVYVSLVKREIRATTKVKLRLDGLTVSGDGAAAGAHKRVFHVFSYYWRILGLSLGYPAWKTEDNRTETTIIVITIPGKATL